MDDPAPITASTRKLIELLARWPRQHIAERVLADADARLALLNGDLAARLPRPPGRGHAYGQGAGAMRHGAVGYFDDEFPCLLRAIPDPPLVLYYQGQLALLDEPAIAIVGARRCTTQGRRNAQTLARDLAGLGVHVVSGLALGIDGAAHEGALLAAGRGRTIAVLGAGLERLYPARHRQLAARILAAEGLLLSEYPAQKSPRRHQFPERNRLISGVSLATVVVEASDRSGSLITARFAAEQGRDVLAMPGSVQSLVSAGCHRLIQEGAALVTDAAEVIANAGLEPQAPQAPRNTAAPGDALTATGQSIYAHLHGYAVSVDELLALTAIPPAELTCALVELELAGFVEQGPLGYIRTS